MLKAIKAITQQSEDETYHYETVMFALKKLLNMKQGEDESLHSFAARFNNTKDIFESKFGGTIPFDSCVKANPRCANQGTTVKEVMLKEGYDRFMSIVFMWVLKG